MDLADFRALMTWLYGDSPEAAAGDTRINARNLRGYFDGRSTWPDALEAYLVGRAALRRRLKGWQLEEPPVSPATLQRIKDHVVRPD